MEFVATDNTQLDALANQDPYLKKVYEGSFPCDLLPRSPNKAKPTAYIVNTDPVGQPGQHWIALWTQNNVCEVMDSYGLPLEWYRTTRPIIDWITSHWKHWVTNGTTLQGLHSYACGQYCITYLKMKARGGSLQDFLALFSEHDYVKNDQKVGDMIEYVACRPGQQTCQMREKVIKKRWMVINYGQLLKRMEFPIVKPFQFHTPSSILIVGPSGCGKTVFTQKLLENNMDLFETLPQSIHYCYGAWQPKFADMSFDFHEGIPELEELDAWFPNGQGILVWMI